MFLVPKENFQLKKFTSLNKNELREYFVDIVSQMLLKLNILHNNQILLASLIPEFLYFDISQRKVFMPLPLFFIKYAFYGGFNIISTQQSDIDNDIKCNGEHQCDKKYKQECKGNKQNCKHNNTIKQVNQIGEQLKKYTPKWIQQNDDQLCQQVDVFQLCYMIYDLFGKEQILSKQLQDICQTVIQSNNQQMIPSIGKLLDTIENLKSEQNDNQLNSSVVHQQEQDQQQEQILQDSIVQYAQKLNQELTKCLDKKQEYHINYKQYQQDKNNIAKQIDQDELNQRFILQIRKLLFKNLFVKNIQFECKLYYQQTVFIGKSRQIYCQQQNDQISIPVDVDIQLFNCDDIQQILDKNNKQIKLQLTCLINDCKYINIECNLLDTLEFQWCCDQEGQLNVYFVILPVQ